MNRLLTASYGEGSSLSANANRFTEQITGYDKNGNILGLKRYGQTGAGTYGLFDDLTVTLSGNQLKSVNDVAASPVYNNGFEFRNGIASTQEYNYDKNGNLTQDLNKDVSKIEYNLLNLPLKVTFRDGSTFSYIYGGNGAKLKTTHKIGTVTTATEYCSDMVYENDVAKLLLTEAGYITLSDEKYHYYLQDHQGNNRVVIDQNGSVEETNHYYPFGGVFASSGNVQPYKYNGKEFDAKKGLNWYDYGARHYDAALGRFHTNDRFAEKYYSMSMYQYGANNPVRNVDVNGDSIVVLNHGEGLHMAMLIQNETNKWQYFSINGNNVYISGKFAGGRKFNDIAVGEFNTPQEFFESYYNSAGDGDDKSINHYGFSEGYIIPTSEKQDYKIREAFIEISQNEEYCFLGNNCITTVQRSLEAAGLKTYDFKRKTYKIPASHYLGESSFTVIHGNGRPQTPSAALRAIMKHNPQGKFIHRLK